MMLFGKKAIIISHESLSYILQTIPEDATGEYGAIGAEIRKTLKMLTNLRTKLDKERHDWSTKALGEDKCPCGDCDEETAENELRMEKCLRDATLEDINTPEVANQCEAVQPPSAKSSIEETPLNTLTTETPVSCDA